MKFFLTTCATILLAATTSAASAEQRELQVVPVTVKGITSIQKDLLAAVNVARVANGKTPLCLNAKLTEATQGHSVDMGNGGFISSAGTSGSTPTSRATAVQFNTTGVAELVGAGYTSTEVAIQEWMSAPAYSMYLLGDYKYLGAGYSFNPTSTYKTFWALDFDKDAVGEVCA